MTRALAGLPTSTVAPNHSTACCGFNALIIHDVPNLSLSCPKRIAKNVSSIGMKICPPSESNVQMRYASDALSTVSERYTLRIG